MQFISVSQFYQSIICFSIPLLIIQRFILFWYGLSNKYEDYRRTFYQDQFRFLKQDSSEGMGDITIKERMIDEKNQGEPSYLQDFSPQTQGRQSIAKEQHLQKKKSKKSVEEQNTSKRVDLVFERDMQLHNKQNICIPTSKPRLSQPQVLPQGIKSQKQKQDFEQPPSKLQQPQQKKPQIPQKLQQTKPQIPQKPQKPAQPEKQKQQIKSPCSPQFVHKESSKSKKQKNRGQKIEDCLVTESDIEDNSNERGEKKEMDNKSIILEQSSKKSQKIVIQLGRGQLQEKGQKDQIKLRYSRRVDDAFNYYIPMILSVIVLGMLSCSVYIYSMCCFFGYAFSTLLYNFSVLLDKMQGVPETNPHLFRKATQLISSLFIIGLFISYWVSKQCQT